MQFEGQEIGPFSYLPHADLSGLDLSGVDLSGSCLIGAKLIGTNLKGSNLSGADFAGADLTGANLRGAILISPSLRLSDEMCTDAWIEFVQGVGDEYPLELELHEWKETQMLLDDNNDWPTKTEQENKRDDLWKRAFIDEFPREPTDFYGNSVEDYEWWQFVMWDNPGLTSYKEVDIDKNGCYHENLFISIYRTNELANLATNFNSCVFSESTIWPDSSMTDDYPIWNQPDGLVWSRTGFAGDSSSWSNYWDGIEIQTRDNWEKEVAAKLNGA